MTILRYLKNRFVLILAIVVIVSFILLTMYYSLRVKQLDVDYKYIIIVVIFLFLIMLFFDYINELRRYNKLKVIINKNELLSEDFEYLKDIDKVYLSLLKSIYLNYHKLNADLKLNQADYQEFIISAIHDIKLPMQALKLIIDSHDLGNDITKEVNEELFRIEQQLEKIMYYFRLDDFNNDYLPSQVSLYKLVSSALKPFSKNFMYKKIKLEIGEINTKVLTDEKWATFIIKQVISNAVKYTNVGGKIKINSYYLNSSPVLSIMNTGSKIKKSDINRIFNRGFTGYIGRNENKATGYGLYLSSKIASKLNIELKVESNENEETTFYLVFKNENKYHNLT